jgi:signal transduction histidine kinase
MRIADQGIGITSDQLDLVMQPFGQVADVAARSHQGTGLGLPLTSRFLQLHGGRLELRSESGAGTTALAWLPAGRLSAADRPCRPTDGLPARPASAATGAAGASTTPDSRKGLRS